MAILAFTNFTVALVSLTVAVNIFLHRNIEQRNCLEYYILYSSDDFVILSGKIYYTNYKYKLKIESVPRLLEFHALSDHQTTGWSL